MSTPLLLLIILGYFLLLMLVSRLTSRNSQMTTFFDGDRRSPWFLVAFGMIGSGISAVSLVSIPGNVGNENLYYFQFILGTILGYLFIAYILIPLFFQQKLVSIYTYLLHRFGKTTYRTGASFFMVSQSFGAALRLLLSIKIIQSAFFDAYHIPHAVTILIVLLMIWLYTNQSGIKTIVWTDALQSFFLLSVILVSITTIINALETPTGLFTTITNDVHFKVFDFDFSSATNFFKQVISGFLITVALVGLDQSMMQKTLTVANAQDAKRNVLTFSFFIAAAQSLFLILGILLYLFADQNHLDLAMQGGKYTHPDELFPYLTLHFFGKIGTIAFFIGVIASTFASIDSCIAALTTSLSYDFFDFDKQPLEQQKKIKIWVLLSVNLAMFLIVMTFWNSQGSIINSIFKVAGYTYGPLLGIYLVGLFSQIQLNEKWVPYMAILAAILTYVLNFLLEKQGFNLGFLNIFINALLTILLLWLIKK